MMVLGSLRPGPGPGRGGLPQQRLAQSTAIGGAGGEGTQLPAPLPFCSLPPGLSPFLPPIPTPGLHWPLLWAAVGRQEQGLPLQRECEGDSESGAGGQEWDGQMCRGGSSPFTPCPGKGHAAPAREYGFVPKDRRWLAPALISAC